MIKALKSKEKAKIVVHRILSDKQPIDQIKKELTNNDESEWFRVSKLAYKNYYQEQRKQREIDARSPNVACTNLDEIKEILDLNGKLIEHALCITTQVTKHDLRTIMDLSQDIPKNEHKISDYLGNLTMEPRWRSLQKKGRFEDFPFNAFSRIIEASVLSYYSQNYISSFLTLVPVIEGTLLRWMGYNGNGKKPEFEDYRKFFENFHVRQPCPGNVLFYEIYSKAALSILTNHFYKPSDQGNAYSNFNRHLAAHLLNDSPFATKENCIRLFILLDILSLLYFYENKGLDRQFYLTPEDIGSTFHVYTLCQHSKNNIHELLNV
ncbi:hypothetical protein [Acinetobacter sp. ANC 5045]|uniref:hypothetical protein n=1 Tax=Acinetobacter sp. ANC 5045 TaxID=2529851 RepID=UPI00103916DD|nr:hypothetical protein [Acinetobacter sp. ANC 5045]TCB17534.1 hypothetical protein E0H79_07850 [Acinetobacter sp. ANC 5045]